jgi:hypothetical protein
MLAIKETRNSTVTPVDDANHGRTFSDRAAPTPLPIQMGVIAKHL